jgi:hypothetical protein
VSSLTEFVDGTHRGMYDPASWPLAGNLSQTYLDELYTVNALIDPNIAIPDNNIGLLAFTGTGKVTGTGKGISRMYE